jgi:hypothetical protein
MPTAFVDLLMDRQALAAGLDVYLLAMCRIRLQLCATLLDFVESGCCRWHGRALEAVVDGRNEAAALLVRLDATDSALDELGSLLHAVDLRLAAALEWASTEALVPTASVRAAPQKGRPPSGGAVVAETLVPHPAPLFASSFGEHVVLPIARRSLRAPRRASRRSHRRRPGDCPSGAGRGARKGERPLRRAKRHG